MPSQANVFNLQGSQIHVSYSSGALGSKAALVYEDSQQTLQFDETQMRRSQTDLGQEVSVTLRQTVDVGSTTFTLAVPRVQVELNQHAPLHTVGVIAVHHTSLAPALNHGQQDLYHVVHLAGSAAAVAF
jgi:hypothetical protein